MLLAGPVVLFSFSQGLIRVIAFEFLEVWEDLFRYESRDIAAHSCYLADDAGRRERMFCTCHQKHGFNASYDAIGEGDLEFKVEVAAVAYTPQKGCSVVFPGELDGKAGVAHYRNIWDV